MIKPKSVTTYRPFSLSEFKPESGITVLPGSKPDKRTKGVYGWAKKQCVLWTGRDLVLRTEYEHGYWSAYLNDIVTATKRELGFLR